MSVTTRDAVGNRALGHDSVTPRAEPTAQSKRSQPLARRRMVSLSSLDWNHALDWLSAIDELRKVVPLEPRNALVSLQSPSELPPHPPKGYWLRTVTAER